MGKEEMGMKSQSAMEYLMTYGWAILIIAVVLGAIYSLGLFNSSSLAPRAQTGSCQVFRPNGPGTVQYISLAGSCTNELPQYVAQFGTANSNINLGNGPNLNTPNSITMDVWVSFSGLNYTSGSSLLTLGTKGRPDCGVTSGWWFSYDNRPGHLNVFDYTNLGSSTSGCDANGNNFGGVYSRNFAKGTWYNFAFVGTLTTATLYINGVQVAQVPVSNTVISNTNSNMYIGGDASSESVFGNMADFQLYNTSLDANSILALYQEGIGGPPINLQSLVGWWPLNGNANDYSGNQNNGQPTAVTFTNQWLGSYTVP